METSVIIGALAAVASTSSFVPQAIKIIRTRDTSSISTGMYIVTVIGFALWTGYGVMLKAWPLIVSNSISLSLAAFILTMKLLPSEDKNKIGNAMGARTEP